MPKSKPWPPGDPLGYAEVANLLNVKRETVQQWSFRDKSYRESGRPALLPDRDYTVNNQPAWERATVIRWAVATHRMTPDDPRVADVDVSDLGEPEAANA